jgi:dTDP-4-dehydrorhamnose 3,5-epimerase-like enzyme
MPYQVIQTHLESVLVLEPKVFGDVRGFFFESFKVSDFEQGSRLERKIRARQP